MTNGEWDDEQRARLGCTRADLPPVEWDIDVGAILRPGSYTGAIEPPTVSDNQRLPKAHPEDPADGCPGGWRLSLYAQSVAPYLRTRAGDGHRVPNPLLDRCEDDAIARAVLFYENEHERCIGHTMKVEEKAREDG